MSRAPSRRTSRVATRRRHGRRWTGGARRSRRRLGSSARPGTGSCSAVIAGEFGLPRCGTGVRYGASVSASISSAGATSAASRRASAFLNVTLPAKLITYPASAHSRRHRRVAGEAVKYHAIGRPRTRLGQDRQDVRVRLAVVDHQRLPGPPGDLDVRAEPLALHGRVRPVAVVVEAGLADRHHPGRLRQRGELGQHLAPAGVHRRGLVRVDRHRRVHLGVLVGAGRPTSATTAGRTRRSPPGRCRRPAPPRARRRPAAP